MRYVVVFVLFAIVFYLSTVIAALLIGDRGALTILLSPLVGSVAGAVVAAVGLKGKIHRRLPLDNPPLQRTGGNDRRGS